MANKDVLEHMLGFVGGETGRQRVKALGQVALVCRQWRDVSSGEALWKGVEQDVVPALWVEGPGPGRAVNRDRLMQYGRMLLAERRVWNEWDWISGLELHVEVFDRMDGLQMLSVRGPLGYADDGPAGRWLTIDEANAREVRGASFSAASRDPEHHRFADIEAYFTQGHQSMYPCSLCVRVTVRNVWTGKGGILWEEDKWMAKLCNDITDWGYGLPAGSISVCTRSGVMVGGGGDGVQCNTRFLVCPEADQAGVAEQDRRYRVATGEDCNLREEYPFWMYVDSTEMHQIRSVIRSMC
jgi:hypothetical protein